MILHKIQGKYCTRICDCRNAISNLKTLLIAFPTIYQNIIIIGIFILLSRESDEALYELA